MKDEEMLKNLGVAAKKAAELYYTGIDCGCIFADRLPVVFAEFALNPNFCTWDNLINTAYGLIVDEIENLYIRALSHKRAEELAFAAAACYGGKNEDADN